MKEEVIMLKKIVCSFLAVSAVCFAGSAAAAPQSTISVVSFDGMGYADTAHYKDRGKMPNLQAFEEKAAVADNMVTVAPSLTAPSHAAIATGASPAATGIVSNQFHSEGQTVKEDQSGFTQTLGVTPIWKKVKDDGKVTATVAFPGSNPNNASAATYSVYPGGTQIGRAHV